MPTKSNRPSLTTTLEQRYATQRVGEAFDVKSVLGNPGKTPPAGEIIDATSMNGTQFQNPDGFQVKMPMMMTQLKDAQGTTSKQLSRYAQNLDTTKYH